MIRTIIKSVIGKYLYSKLSFIYSLIINFERAFPQYALSRKTYVKDDKNKNIFSVRSLGGATSLRAKSFYKKEPDTIEWINGFEENSILFDIGANIGIYSLYAASKKTSVVAVEPDSLNFAALNLNIYDNNFNKLIKAYPFSIDDKKVVSDLHKLEFRFGGSTNSFDRIVNEDGKSFEPKFIQGSPSISLDNLSKNLGLKPSYIKIDVDGNELKIINSMNSLLSNSNLISILIELSENFHEHMQVIKILEKNNFKFISKRLCNEYNLTHNYIFEKNK